MAYNKRTWLGRQGTGLNKFSIGGASPVTIVNQPDSVTQVGDALSAGNLNDLEDRIEDAFDDVDTALDTKADEQDVTNLNNAISQLDHRVQNLEQAKGSYVVQNYKDGSITPSGKGNWAVVEGLRGVSRVENQLIEEMNSTNFTLNNATGSFSDGVCTFTASAYRGTLAMSHRTLSSEAGHTILISVKIKTTTATTNVRLYTYGGNATLSCEATTNWQTLSRLITTNASWGYDLTNNNKATVEDTRNADWDAVQVKDFIATDLSVYFGGTIPSDADTIAEIQQNYPHLLTPSEYGVRIVDSSYSGVRAWGKNLCDTSAFENVNIATDGSVSPNPVCASSTDYIKVQAGSAMTFSTKTAIFGVRIAEYDLNKNFIKRSDSLQTTSITLQSNTQYVRWIINYDGSTTVTKAILDSIEPQLEYGSSRTTFSEYREPSTLSLTFQGKSAGSVSEMYYPETGEQTHPLSADQSMSDIGFGGYDSTTKTYVKTGGTWVSPSSNDDVADILCSYYVPVSRNNLLNNDKCICINSAGALIVRDTSFTGNGDTFNGTIRYALATPAPSTFVTPIIDNTLLTEAYGRMSTVQTGTVVDGSFDMGFINL